jgi:hypothetical protein
LFRRNFLRECAILELKWMDGVGLYKQFE